MTSFGFRVFRWELDWNLAWSFSILYMKPLLVALYCSHPVCMRNLVRTLFTPSKLSTNFEWKQKLKTRFSGKSTTIFGVCVQFTIACQTLFMHLPKKNWKNPAKTCVFPGLLLSHQYLYWLYILNIAVPLIHNLVLHFFFVCVNGSVSSALITFTVIQLLDCISGLLTVCICGPFRPGWASLLFNTSTPSIAIIAMQFSLALPSCLQLLKITEIASVFRAFLKFYSSRSLCSDRPRYRNDGLSPILQSTRPRSF